MKKFELLEHQADLKIKAFGKTKKELFLNALLAMNKSMEPEIKKSSKDIKRKIKIKSFDSATLLIDFLNEILYLVQINKEIYFDIKFIIFTDKEIKADLLGCKAEKFIKDIKAATYYQLSINKKKHGSWEAIFLFDI